MRVGGHEDLRLDENRPSLTASSRHVRWAQIFEKVGTLGSQDYADWDWGVAGGAGIAIGRGSRRFVTEVRYSRGFVDVIPSDLGSSPSGALSVSLGMEWR